MAKQKSFCNFNKDQDELLIELVSRYPALYDSNHVNYKDCLVRNNIWLEISKLVERKSRECKIRWRSIRDLYIKKKREEQKGEPTTAKKWDLMDQLSFLDNVPNERTSSSNVPKRVTETTATEVNSFSTEFSPEQANSTYYSQFPQLARDKEHPVNIFFYSMGQTVIDFPPAMQAEAKLKVCQIITEMECRLASQLPPPSTTSTLLHPTTSMQIMSSDECQNGGNIEGEFGDQDVVYMKSEFEN